MSYSIICSGEAGDFVPVIDYSGGKYHRFRTNIAKRIGKMPRNAAVIGYHHRSIPDDELRSSYIGLEQITFPSLRLVRTHKANIINHHATVDQQN